MRFIDEAEISLQAGHGGSGCIAFRREKYVPMGGPAGGDGGNGGDVVIMASSRLETLQDFRFKRIYRAPGGRPGGGSNCTGRSGDTLVVKVPVGTLLKHGETGDILVDFMEDGQTWVACRGGRGGKGNAHFATSVHRTPKFAQPGEPGDSLKVRLELKLIADVGIIGFPNAGKSTLISVVSAARPKVADYAFTTLTPNLGVVEMDHFERFVIADIPGLVVGAHRGEGLGHRFLKHIERNKIFLHLLDGAQLLEAATRPDEEETFQQAVEELVDGYQAIRKELELFNPELLQKPEVVVLNKRDLLESSPELLEKVRVALKTRIQGLRSAPPLPGEPFIISAATGTGIKDLKNAIFKEVVARRPQNQTAEDSILLPHEVDAHGEELSHFGDPLLQSAFLKLTPVETPSARNGSELE